MISAMNLDDVMKLRSGQIDGTLLLNISCSKMVCLQNGGRWPLNEFIHSSLRASSPMNFGAVLTLETIFDLSLNLCHSCHDHSLAWLSLRRPEPSHSSRLKHLIMEVAQLQTWHRNESFLCGLRWLHSPQPWEILIGTNCKATAVIIVKFRYRYMTLFVCTWLKAVVGERVLHRVRRFPTW